jgi:CheY-like chemotaxis protein
MVASSPTVLLVEDDAASAYALGRYLGNKGYRVITESRAMAALDQWECNSIDVVIADVRLAPGGPDGILLARMFKSERANVPIIFVTAYPEMVQGKGSLPGPVFYKPVELPELHLAVEEVVPIKHAEKPSVSNHGSATRDPRKAGNRLVADRAISDFFDKGGQVLKLPMTVPVTEGEVVDYLRSCGIQVQSHPTNSGVNYTYQRKPVSVKKLIHLANEHRLEQQLPPFAAKI